MADKRISGLPAATTPLDGTEVLAGVQAGANAGVSVADVVHKSRTASVVDVASSAGAASIDLSLDARVFTCTLTEATTFTFDSVPATGSTSFHLILTQDATGGWTTTLPASVVYDAGVIPSISTAANATAHLKFSTVDGGISWFAVLETNNYDTKGAADAAVAAYTAPVVSVDGQTGAVDLSSIYDAAGAAAAVPDGDFKSDGSVPMSGNLDMGGFQRVNDATPTPPSGLSYESTDTITAAAAGKIVAPTTVSILADVSLFTSGDALGIANNIADTPEMYVHDCKIVGTTAPALSSTNMTSSTGPTGDPRASYATAAGAAGTLTVDPQDIYSAGILEFDVYAGASGFGQRTVVVTDNTGKALLSSSVGTGQVWTTFSTTVPESSSAVYTITVTPVGSTEVVYISTDIRTNTSAGQFANGFVTVPAGTVKYIGADAYGNWAELSDAPTGIVESIIAGSGVTVDSTDPANPVVSAAGGVPWATYNLSNNDLQFATETCTQTEGPHHTQFGSGNTQSGNYGYNTQFGQNNTQSGNYENVQFGHSNNQTGNMCIQQGYNNTQSGVYSLQVGANNTKQAGYANIQIGKSNSQSGYYGLQVGKTLDDGGFHYAYMLGDTKTATVASRLYLALTNGMWIKPNTADPSSPEEGVLYYNSTTHKLKVYTGTAWETVTSS